MESTDAVSPAALSGGAVLEVQGLRLRRGAREILRGVSLQVSRGELVALMGLSGGGKTTVLRVVAGLEPFDAGEVCVAGVRLQPGGRPLNGTLDALRRKVGMVFQFHFLFEHLPAIRNVSLAPVHVHKMPRAEAERRAQGLLDHLGVGARARALPRELSGGEAQRVAIARALAVDPPLLLMDEPTASLDPARRGALGETLRGLTSEGRTLLAVTHDDDFVRDFATRVIVMDEGVVVEEGDPGQVLSNPTHEATRRLLQTGSRRTPPVRA